MINFENFFPRNFSLQTVFDKVNHPNNSNNNNNNKNSAKC